MSIVVLKKKSRSNSRFAPISGRGDNGFSLNGGYRNIGAVGQFRMISNTTRTPFRGTHPMGNGGKYGAYYPLDQCLEQPMLQPASGAQSIPTGGMRQLV